MKNLFDNWRTSFLVEARVDDLIAKYPDDEKVIRYFSDNDPAGNDKYLKWMHKQFLKSVASPQIIAKVATDFHKNRQRLDNKDIYQWDFNDLKNKLDALGKTNKQKKEEDAIKVYEDDEWLFVVPTTKKTTCTYGSNTKWCITSTDTLDWENYVAEGFIFLFVINKTKSSENPENSWAKWALTYMPQPDKAWPILQIFDGKDKKIGKSYIQSVEMLESRLGEDRADLIYRTLQKEYDNIIKKINLPEEKDYEKLLGIADKLNLEPKIRFADVEISSYEDLRKTKGIGDLRVKFESTDEGESLQLFYEDELRAQINTATLKSHGLMSKISFDEIENSILGDKNIKEKFMDLLARGRDLTKDLNKDPKTIGDVIEILVQSGDPPSIVKREIYERLAAWLTIKIAKPSKIFFKHNYSLDLSKNGKLQLKYFGSGVNKQIIQKAADDLLRSVSEIKYYKKKIDNDPLWQKIN